MDPDPESITDPGPEMGSLTDLRMRDIEVLEMVNITDPNPEMGTLVDIRMWGIEVLEMVNITDLDPESITDLDPEMGSLIDLRMWGIEVLEMVNITDPDPDPDLKNPEILDILLWMVVQETLETPTTEMIKEEVQEAMKMMSLDIQVQLLNN